MEQDLVIGDFGLASDAEAKAEVERLLADGRFRISVRNRAFLRYLAEASFSGQTSGVKAYTVAIDVFGRPTNFDQNTDPIVRIEATRLRAALERYYDAFGRETSVRIELPRGRYILQFRATTAIEGLYALPKTIQVQNASPTLEIGVERRLESFVILLGAIVVVLVGVLLGFGSLSRGG